MKAIFYLSKSKNYLIFIFYILIISITSCKSNFVKLKLDKINPTEYTYPYSKNKVYNSIIENFNYGEYKGMSLYSNNLGGILLNQSMRPILKKNKYDIFLNRIGPIGESNIYFKKGLKKLDYEAEFYIQLDSLDKEKTKVKIITYNSKVIVGRELIPLPPHFIRKNKYQTVEPSTIEEYELLLQIGEVLGLTDMPQLISPALSEE